MYTLEITASAEADLNQITDYLGKTLANPPAALAVLDEVDRVSDTLEETPGFRGGTDLVRCHRKDSFLE